MQILVTGGAGQVGRAVTASLAPLGTVVATDRAQFDLAQPEKLPRVLERLEPEIIINAAAYTMVDQAEDEPALAMCVNATAPGVIAQWAAQHNVPLIHFSSDYVFDGTGERPWGEGDGAAPLSAYGASKLAGEAAIRAAGGRFLIVRTSWVYAAQGKNFLRTIARLAGERRELRIVADQIGAPTSATLLAGVVARMLAQGLDGLAARMQEADGLVHVTAAGETSWHGFAAAIVEGLRSRGVTLAVERVVPIRSDEYPTKARRPHNSRLDLRRLHDVFGIMPPRWEDDLAGELATLTPELART
jgi:dTDP-4-dehydrorhamnose reductase